MLLNRVLITEPGWVISLATVIHPSVILPGILYTKHQVRDFLFPLHTRSGIGAAHRNEQPRSPQYEELNPRTNPLVFLVFVYMTQCISSFCLIKLVRVMLLSFAVKWVPDLPKNQVEKLWNLQMQVVTLTPEFGQCLLTDIRYHEPSQLT